VTESPIFGEHYHGSSTRQIAESAWRGYETISQVGIRGYEGPEFFEFTDDVGLTVFTKRNVAERGIVDTIEAAAADSDAVYLTFDIDSVDPSVAPGTGTPEPVGLSAHEALQVMEVAGTHPTGRRRRSHGDVAPVRPDRVDTDPRSQHTRDTLGAEVRRKMTAAVE
jgi:agmatinase